METKALRDGFGEGLMELGENNSQVVVLTADVEESTRVKEFAEKWPERFVQCGVAEQNMMGIAAGMAAAGKIPFVSTYAVFSPGRNWDQLRVAVCYSKLPVKIVGHSAGLLTGADGATHQALEDIAITRVLPELSVVIPADAREARKATIAAADYPGPVYLRMGRDKTAVLTSEEEKFEIGKAKIMREGDQVAVIGGGPILGEVMAAAQELAEKGIEVMVINSHTIKPLDKVTLLLAAKKCRGVVTVEDHQVTGGLGGAVAELLGTNYPVPIEMVGMKDTFGESGKPEELYKKYGLDKEEIKMAVLTVIKRKNYNNS